MGMPTTAREALLAEAIGEFGGMLAQVQQLLVSMDAARKGIVGAQAQMAQQIDALHTKNEAQLHALAEQAKTQVAKHIAAHAAIAANRSAEQQKQAIREAARACFQAEVDAAAARLGHLLRENGQPPPSLIERVLIPLGAATLASALTWIASAWAGA